MVTQVTDKETPQPTRRGVLGAWDSPLTSYYLVLGSTLLLTMIGLIMVLASSSVVSLSAGGSAYSVFAAQARIGAAALVLMWIASRVPPAFFQRIAWPLLGVGIVGQLLVYTPLGVAGGGSLNWIRIGGQIVQPSEGVKVALALWVGAVLARKRPLLGDWKHALIPVVPGTLVVVGTVLGGGDLGTSVVMMGLVGGAMFVAGVPMRIFGFAGVAAAAGAVALALTSGNRMRRITSWLSADCDPQDGCYQSIQGVRALATGGLWGIGLGESRSKWNYLPEVETDFIFAVIGEELGLLGTLVVLGLYAALAVGMSRIIVRHTSPFAKITTAAVATWIIGQSVTNIAVVTGLLPVLGVPLPLVSVGGSALVGSLAALGVVLAFARTEPGAPEALAARGRTARRVMGVVGRVRR
ncbi:peptidoglycan glycosyltransferase FtsW [Cellulomonas bogoriensis]|uniref:Probable peptidoglycan glycosyltransferase FtsW n=1 Tax=Cellulomonas bogoriensis 69B4 = DSM 16987 TaxID=1386082 RepID=A0A0A0BPQ8_9CELL|nr:putative peptidoglycan glycosyltransferase FtsW [Cellulomonas bogoriensis]KGM09921.1 cell division protein FtsW [Cellulomonas bogoriensis 69B4 = DSM 16987]